MLQQKQDFLHSYMVCNISCITHMDLLFIQGRGFSKKMRAYFNFSSSQVIQISTKHKNITTYHTHTVMNIMLEISVTGVLSPHQLTSLNDIIIYLCSDKKSETSRSIPNSERYQCIQQCYIRTGLETFVEKWAIQ